MSPRFRSEEPDGVTERSADLFADFGAPPAPPERPVPHNRTVTSRAAAESIKPARADQRHKILGWLNRNGRATEEKISASLKMNPNSTRPRLVSLLEDGYVAQLEDEGLTEAKRRAKLWAITDRGRDHWTDTARQLGEIA